MIITTVSFPLKQTLRIFVSLGLLHFLLINFDDIWVKKLLQSYKKLNSATDEKRLFMRKKQRKCQETNNLKKAEAVRPLS